MEKFLRKEVEGNQFELLIDSKVYTKNIVLKAAYTFLDKGYFFFKMDKDNNIVLQFTEKGGVRISAEEVIGEFSDELLAVYLRDTLEKENKAIREAIVEKSINGPLDIENFVSLDSDTNTQQNQTDFDKDIDDILKEIEDDPDLKIDEAEIESILKEIEEETRNETQKPTITLNPEAVKKAKQDFTK